MTLRPIVLAVVILLVVSGCDLVRAPAVPVVDGWPIGPVAACGPGDRCAELLAAATAGLAGRDPGHVEIVAATLHGEGELVDPATGDRILRTRSGGPLMIARFELADGTVRAIGVGFLGISREPIVLERP